MTDPKDSQDNNDQESQQSGPPPIPGVGSSDHNPQSGPPAPPEENISSAHQGGYTYAQPTSQPPEPGAEPAPYSHPTPEPQQPQPNYSQPAYQQQTPQPPQQQYPDYGQQQAYQQPPNYYQPQAQEDGGLISALIIGEIGLAMSLCCFPIGFFIGIYSIIVGRSKKNQATPGTIDARIANVIFWTGIATIIFSFISLGLLILQLALPAMFPDIFPAAY